MGEITFDKEMKVGQWHSETPDYSAAYNQWQPIETAPKDGRSLLLFDGGSIFMGCFVWQTRCWSMNGWVVKPTHWMPLPPPPSKPIG